MPEQVKLFYPNCTCCGSGSGSGSGSCDCYFFNGTYLSSLYGTGSESPISDGWGSCSDSAPPCSKTDFVLNIYMNYNGCGSIPVGSCGSGSSGSGDSEPSLSGSPLPIGSGSSGSSGSTPCLSTCPSCCDIFKTRYQLYLTCRGDYMATANLTNPTTNCTDWPSATYAECKGAHPDCNWAWVGRNANSGDSRGFAGIAVDGGWIPIQLSNPALQSCNPLLVTGSGSLNGAAGLGEGAALYMACLLSCFAGSTFGNDGNADLSCVTYTWAITEASSGGGGGGGPPPPV